MSIIIFILTLLLVLCAVPIGLLIARLSKEEVKAKARLFMTVSFVLFVVGSLIAIAYYPAHSIITAIFMLLIIVNRRRSPWTSSKLLAEYTLMYASLLAVMAVSMLMQQPRLAAFIAAIGFIYGLTFAVLWADVRAY